MDDFLVYLKLGTASPYLLISINEDEAPTPPHLNFALPHFFYLFIFYFPPLH